MFSSLGLTKKKSNSKENLGFFSTSMFKGKTIPQKITDDVFIEINKKLMARKKNMLAVLNHINNGQNFFNIEGPGWVLRNRNEKFSDNIPESQRKSMSIEYIYEHINKPLFSNIKELKDIIKKAIPNNTNKQLIYGINNNIQNTNIKNKINRP